MSRTSLISIVDDDESVRTAMSSLVRSLGFAAVAFASAEEFLASPTLNETSCLVVDVQMPGMSGLELQSELTSRDRRMPVIFITAFPEERIRRRAEAGGAAGFFGKPVDGQALIRCLDTVLKSI